MNQRADTVLLTRRTWDRYMIPAFLAALAIGLFRAWLSGESRFAIAPVSMLLIWLFLRLTTPRKGMPTPTIRSTPGTVTLLWYSGIALALTLALTLVDVYIFHHPLHASLECYHALLCAPPFIFIFLGAYRSDRIKKSHNQARDQ